MTLRELVGVRVGEVEGVVEGVKVRTPATLHGATATPRHSALLPPTASVDSLAPPAQVVGAEIVEVVQELTA